MNNYKTNLKINNVVSREFLGFAKNNYLDKSYFIHNSYGACRFYCVLNKTQTSVTKLALNLRKQMFLDFGIKSFKEEPFFGIFLSVNTAGGFVHEHIDSTICDHYHVRLNFLLSKPHKGGIPVINNKEIEVSEGESWLNLSSEWKHKSTLVEGNKPRVVLSLGALVEKKQVDPILKEMGIE